MMLGITKVKRRNWAIPCAILLVTSPVAKKAIGTIVHW